MSDFQKYLKYKNKYKKLLAGSYLSTNDTRITVTLEYALVSDGKFNETFIISNNISLENLLNLYTKKTGIHPSEVYKKGDEYMDLLKNNIIKKRLSELGITNKTVLYIVPIKEPYLLNNFNQGLIDVNHISQDDINNPVYTNQDNNKHIISMVQLKEQLKRALDVNKEKKEKAPFEICIEVFERNHIFQPVETNDIKGKYKGVECPDSHCTLWNKNIWALYYTAQIYGATTSKAEMNLLERLLPNEFEWNEAEDIRRIKSGNFDEIYIFLCDHVSITEFEGNGY